MFSRDVIEELIGIQEAKDRCEAINLADHPEDALVLKALHEHLEIWLGIKDGDLFHL